MDNFGQNTDRPMNTETTDTLGFTEADRRQLREKGITEEKLHRYRRVLKEGLPRMRIHSNATVDRGIHVLSDEEGNEFADLYRRRGNTDVVKFVPASGAATRMFKDLFQYLEGGESTEEIERFFGDLVQYPFYELLSAHADLDRETLKTEEGRKKALEKLLLEDGLGYGHLPKGAITFHRYADGTVRTAFEEHFYEAALYAGNPEKGSARIFFTVPPTGGAEIDEILIRGKQAAGERFGMDFRVETDPQKPSTDTPAIEVESGKWARDESGGLLLRPAGHGALLENLNALNADVIFVKNIDNVVPDRLKDITVKHKERLGGVLLHVRDRLFGFMRDFDEGRLERATCAAFLAQWFEGDFEGKSAEELAKYMDRPLRVCGMVKNQGEPGGGPFYVEDEGGPTLQIVEKAQLDLDDPGQAEIFRKATHFNPVDLVLSVKNHRGEKYDLNEYSNPDTAMVVDKTHFGAPIKALESPGLWNGAMHHWNTVFVEVPIETFNPVKTVFDLVRESHVATV